MNISELEIKKFRHLHNISIDFGHRLTAIAGQNGTGKSTILGLIGHVCREKTGYQTFDNKKFATEYSEIFKFSFPDYDKPKEHIYNVNFTNDISTQVVSYARKEKNKPESLRLRVGESTKRGGQIDFPVIFLGLKRLIPLAQERTIKANNHSLTDEELNFFKETHNSILLLTDEVSSEEIKSSNKHFLAATTETYDAIGNSAGQDNVGQIITSIISFQRLKKHLGDNYRGGVLLIDELDASMFPAAQKKLVEFLFKISSKLNLQVIFTTHSIEVLEILLASKYKYDAKVCYLHNNHGEIKKAEMSKLNEIIADLKAEVLPEKVKDIQIEVYLEDKEAQQFLKSILPPQTKKRIKFVKATFGAHELINLANKRIPAFNRSIIVLDGDMFGKLKQPKPSNVIILPGNDSPEKIMFQYLKNLPQNSSFWGDLGGYTKQICFRDLNKINDRDAMKEWWNNQIKYWGVNGRKLFQLWKSDNEKSVNSFIKEFEKKVNMAYKNTYKL